MGTQHLAQSAVSPTILPNNPHGRLREELADLVD